MVYFKIILSGLTLFDYGHSKFFVTPTFGEIVLIVFFCRICLSTDVSSSVGPSCMFPPPDVNVLQSCVARAPLPLISLTWLVTPYRHHRACLHTLAFIFYKLAGTYKSYLRVNRSVSEIRDYSTSLCLWVTNSLSHLVVIGSVLFNI